MAGTERDDAGYQGFDGLGNEGLDQMAFDRKAKSGEPCEQGAAAGHRQSDLAAADRSPRRLDSNHAVAFADFVLGDSHGQLTTTRRVDEASDADCTTSSDVRSRHCVPS